MLSKRAILDKLVQCLFLSLLLNTCPVFSTTVDTIIKETENILTNGKYLNILYHRHADSKEVMSLNYPGFSLTPGRMHPCTGAHHSAHPSPPLASPFCLWPSPSILSVPHPWSFCVCLFFFPNPLYQMSLANFQLSAPRHGTVGGSQFILFFLNLDKITCFSLGSFLEATLAEIYK